MKYSKVEEDGTTTYIHAEDCGGVLKTHNNKVAAVTNKGQKLKEYYLYGVKLDKVEWEKRRKWS